MGEHRPDFELGSSSEPVSDYPVECNALSGPNSSEWQAPGNLPLCQIGVPNDQSSAFEALLGRGEAMTRPLFDYQSELPRSIRLFRYTPDRLGFSWSGWDPSLVQSALDLPPYLILGDLDSSTFEQSTSGWSARWQGTEIDTHFEVAYKNQTGRWEIRQTWCGLDGGFGSFPARMPLDKAIAQTLYLQFPSNWGRDAKSQLEAAYQVTVVDQPEDAYTYCGIPDGAFRTIVFPIDVRNLRPFRQWMEHLVEETPLSYPVSIEAKLVFQALNYLEGKAPTWTAQDGVAFNQSVIETGLAPQGFPVRETASDGSVAWTLRREVYFLFINLPFAGLTDFLDRMATANGPIRTASGQDLRFELRPIVLPASFEFQTENVAFWDKKRSTRSFLQFGPSSAPQDATTMEGIMECEREAPVALAKAEAISSKIVGAIEQIFQRVTKGGAS